MSMDCILPWLIFSFYLIYYSFILQDYSNTTALGEMPTLVESIRV